MKIICFKYRYLWKDGVGNQEWRESFDIVDDKCIVAELFKKHQEGFDYPYKNDPYGNDYLGVEIEEIKFKRELVEKQIQDYQKEIDECEIVVENRFLIRQMQEILRKVS